MFEQASAREPRNVYTDWLIRGAIAIAFAVFGAEKFSSNGTSSWVNLFREIGFGQWFRYFTGVVEVLGGVLVLIPWTAMVGLGLLAATMAGAALILVFVLGRPGDSIVSCVFCIGLTAYFWVRRSR